MLLTARSKTRATRAKLRNGLLEAVKWFVGKSHIYQNLSKAYRIALAVPTSVASNERSFSKLKLVKCYLRSTMKEERLDYLMVAACSSDILDRLDLDEVADTWSILKTRRINHAGLYVFHVPILFNGVNISLTLTFQRSKLFLMPLSLGSLH